MLARTVYELSEMILKRLTETDVCALYENGVPILQFDATLTPFEIQIVLINTVKEGKTYVID